MGVSVGIGHLYVLPFKFFMPVLYCLQSVSSNYYHGTARSDYSQRIEISCRNLDF